MQNTEHLFHILALIHWNCWNCSSLNQEFCPEGWSLTTSVFLLVPEATWLTSYSGNDPGWEPQQHLVSPRAINATAAAPSAFWHSHHLQSSSSESRNFACCSEALPMLSYCAAPSAFWHSHHLQSSSSESRNFACCSEALPMLSYCALHKSVILLNQLYYNYVIFVFLQGWIASSSRHRDCVFHLLFVVLFLVCRMR